MCSLQNSVDLQNPLGSGASGTQTEASFLLAIAKRAAAASASTCLGALDPRSPPSHRVYTSAIKGWAYNDFEAYVCTIVVPGPFGMY